MTDMDYRDMAKEIRSLLPLLLHRETLADLRLLADRYERVADYLEVHPGNRLAAPLPGEAAPGRIDIH